MAEREVYDVYVTLPGTAERVLAGELDWEDLGAERAAGGFTYADSYLEDPRAYALDPFSLPLRVGREGAPHAHGLFGVLRDAGPDSWGRSVLNDKLGQNDMPEVDYLVLSPQDGVGNITVVDQGDSPKDADYLKAYTLDRLAEGVAHIEDAHAKGETVSDTSLTRLVYPNTALGGARPKVTVEDSSGLWMAKFASREDTLNIPRIEYATLELARRAGIDVPDTKIVSVGGHDVLMVKRFDRQRSQAGEIRFGFASAMTVLRSEQALLDRDRWSYLDLADYLRRWLPAAEKSLPSLFDRAVFNCLVSNTDDHPRNHGVLRDQAGWELTPAYDILPARVVSQERRDLSMAVGLAGRAATRSNLLSDCARFGVTPQEANARIDAMREVVAGWEEVFTQAGVNEKDRQAVARAFNYPGFEYVHVDPVSDAVRTGQSARRARRDLRTRN